MSKILALTSGDPSGIGPELALACWQLRHLQDVPPFFLLSDPDFMSSRARRMAVDVPVEVSEPEAAYSVFA
jgi:4-hydroxythreonine-4-phosphate dehydrogenase